MKSDNFFFWTLAALYVVYATNVIEWLQNVFVHLSDTKKVIALETKYQTKQYLKML